MTDAVNLSGTAAGVAAADPPVARASDGCYHPKTEAELAALVTWARAANQRVRVLGSSHSVWRAIVVDGFDDADVPPHAVQIVLDGYTSIVANRPHPTKPGWALVEVQGGCHLGAAPRRSTQNRFTTTGTTDVRRPSPWHDAAWEPTLNASLDREGLALSDLGGITHQTVAGFLQTGSSGGTTDWSIHACIFAMRIVDGEGVVRELRRDSGDEDEREGFSAAGIAMGLCGVVSTVTLECEPRFDLVGSETISEARQCDVLDFYGDRKPTGLPSLAKFIQDTEYTRIMWWPQRGFDRLVVWQAARAAYDPKMVVKPYREIAAFPVLSQIAASVVYTILDNIHAPHELLEKLRPLREDPEIREHLKGIESRVKLKSAFTAWPDPSLDYETHHVSSWVDAALAHFGANPYDPITLGEAWVTLIDTLVLASESVVVAVLNLPGIKQLLGLLGELVPSGIDEILGLFVSTGKNGAPATQHFQDRWYLGLPMDNQIDDLLMPTWFTELWIPFEEGDGVVDGVIAALRKHFDADGTAEGAFAATGPFCFEIYAAKADETFFLSAANGKKNVLRIDVFWFARSAGDPVMDFYPQFWTLLEPFGFRGHWGKFLPEEATQRQTHLAQFPDLDRWKRVRAKFDPHGVFLTDYWRKHLQIA